MINEKIQNILNEQINKEFFSAYFYLMIAANLEDKGLNGFAHWNRIQAQEEIDHGMIIFNYILNSDGKIILGEIKPPQCDCENILDVFEHIYRHEKSITSSINDVTILSMDECDLATRTFIEWYINEQVEEEHAVADIVKRIKFANGDKAALLQIDRELSKRKYEKHEY